MSFYTIFILVCTLLLLFNISGQITCPTDGHEIGGMCYVYRNTEQNASDADKDCTTLGGNLVSVPDETTQATLEKLMSDYNSGVSSMWTGAKEETDTHTEWRWVSGKLLLKSIQKTLQGWSLFDICKHNLGAPYKDW